MSLHPGTVRALCFDIFGTVVDWRGSIVRDGGLLGQRLGLDIDWAAFDDDPVLGAAGTVPCTYRQPLPGPVRRHCAN